MGQPHKQYCATALINFREEHLISTTRGEIYLTFNKFPFYHLFYHQHDLPCLQVGLTKTDKPTEIGTLSAVERVQMQTSVNSFQCTIFDKQCLKDLLLVISIKLTLPFTKDW